MTCKWIGRRFAISCFVILAGFYLSISNATITQADASSCDIRAIAEKAKAISVLRKMENALNFMALAQTDAIVAVYSGIPQGPAAKEHGFFGIFHTLEDNIDKPNSELFDADKAIRRLTIFDRISSDYDEIWSHKEIIVSAGEEILELLKSEKLEMASGVYATRTYEALWSARNRAYTVMSELDREISLDGLRCR